MEDKEKVVEEENKSGTNKFLVVIIVILLLIIAVGFGFFIGKGNDDKTDSNKDNDKVIEETDKDDIDNAEDKEEVKVEELTKDSSVVKNLFSIYNEVNNGMYDIHRDYDLTKINVKKSLAADVLSSEGKLLEKTCGSLSVTYTKDGYLCDSYNLVYKDNGDIDYAKYPNAVKNSKVKTFTSGDLKAKYLELFGQNAEYSDTSFLSSFSGRYAYYDASNSLYAYFSNGSGSEAVEATHVLDSIEQKGTSLKLFTTLSLKDGTITKIDYTFEYEKETGNYIFVSRIVV